MSDSDQARRRPGLFSRRPAVAPRKRVAAETETVAHAAANAAEAVGSVPPGMQIAGAWAWRLLVIAGALAVLLYLIAQFSLVVIPLFIAVVLAALLVPFKNLLVRHGWPKWLAVVVPILSVFIVIGGLGFLVATQVSSGYADLKTQSTASYNMLRDYLHTGPLQLSDDQINGYIGQIFTALQNDSSALVSGALSVGSTLTHVLTGVLLVLFSTLFILIDGQGIWQWVVRVFPKRARQAVDGAGKAGWSTLQSFIRVQILVAFVDAVGIGAGALILQVPLAIPIAVLVFLGSFIPVVGAVLTGAVAVFIALIYNGWVVALIMLGVVLLVQQVEGHVLQPLVMGTAVKVHPLAVVLAVAGGSIIAGIPGAFFAVPFIAVLNVIVKYIASGVWHSRAEPKEPQLNA
ncbi:MULTISPECIES: AI-2E family transporter [Subtercola]|uniref:AI-2E family transporter n=1 Tax=Subtercola vilae TaxID=2056433 RepID=A0A4V4RFA6_9MICO|nr:MULTISPECIES: AI-2E family transporter [Subtercola]MEA9985726.1 AI-2E family transporter [Subtercola sp. RTI3]TIH37134.1 AI-2E family transporter [Subtercola vilae]